ncbi:MAG TPA: hypothetical protein VJZ91_12620 [Blastocatellia bacterium]|nr:hypothetical protein [Blastocatellia bacterium]
MLVTGGVFHLGTRTTFSQPDPLQFTHTGEAETGRLRSMPSPRQRLHFTAGRLTNT